MSWKIDNIDFEVYGAFVSKSLGFLDMPRMVDTSINWLDHNGRDVWQTVEEQKYDDREIVLSMWIRGSDYSNFRTRVSAFYDKFTVNGGIHLLSTPYGNSFEVALIAQVQLTRKASYLSTRQIGVFTLRLLVQGDSKVKYMSVFNSGWQLPISVPFGSDAKLTRSLQGVSEITFTSEADCQKPHGRGNYIFYKDEKYIALSYPAVDKIASNKLVYKLTYTHQFFLLRDVLFRVIDRSDTPYQSTVDDIVDRIIENANRVYPGLFVKGMVAVTESRLNQFSNENCLDVLTRICGEYELEWTNKTFSAGVGYVQINVSKTINFETGIHFEYGKDNTLTKISRTVSGRENICTRLYAYGSDKNIPATYGYPRLKLPVEPIVHEFYGMVIERTKVWADIFPMRTGGVTGYLYTQGYTPQWTEELLWNGEFDGYLFHPATGDPNDTKYELTDLSMPFDLKAKDASGNTLYLIAGTKAKIHFNTGDLAGFEFEILDYNHATKTFKLIPYADPQGAIYPNAIFYPKPANVVSGKLADEYKILDINTPQSYIDDAENRLSIAANAYLTELMNRENTYQVETKSNEFWGGLYPGWRVRLSDSDLGVDTMLRIIDLSTNLFTDVSTMTLSTI